MASNSSRWRSGDGVSFSKGRIAIVRMFGGRPPPFRLYRVRQPPSATSATRGSARSALEIPDRGIERLNGIGALNVERERAAIGLVTIFHALVGGPLHPFLQASPVNTFQTHEGVSAERHPPGDRTADVGAHGSFVHLHDGVR